MFEGFSVQHVETAEATIRCRVGGSGPGLLLLHGNPQTHLMWHRIAPALAERFTVVAADLRGYGQSSKPESAPDHEPYSKRAMARDQVAVMRRLGFERFSVVGHDRGGRCAYRMALDHPETVTRVAILDVIPIAEAWRKADARLALSFWPWSLMSQPQPLPERLITAAPDAVIDDAISQWGTSGDYFPAKVRQAYVAALRDPARAHAICEEFRAAATIDREHDEADQRAGRRIECPLLILWDGEGALQNWYDDQGGPIGIWKRWASDVSGKPMRGGHFFPEAEPEATAGELQSFFLCEP